MLKRCCARLSLRSATVASFAVPFVPAPQGSGDETGRPSTPTWLESG